MGKIRNFQPEKLVRSDYTNKNCWLVKTLNYSPAKRCQYCEWRFSRCLFFRYLLISLIFVITFLGLSFLIEERVSKLTVISIFILITTYGYFFNTSTEELIKANFTQKKPKRL